MPFQIIRDDITRVHADAIVNTANPNPVFGRGTDHAIYSSAGREKLLNERKKIGKIAVGEAAVTQAFDLPAKYIIHTVGPVWKGGNYGEFDSLSSCYRKSLLLAKQLGCESIAFPLISSGSYRFPKDKALDVAVNEIRRFLDEEEMDVTLVVFDKKAYELSSELTGSVRAYIDERYTASKRKAEYLKADARREEKYRRGAAWREEEYRQAARNYKEEESGDTAILPDLSETEEKDALPGNAPLEPMGSFPDSPCESARPSGRIKKKPALQKVSTSGVAPDLSVAASAPNAPAAAPAEYKKKRSLSDLKSQLGMSYRDCLFRLIDERGYTDAEVYKKANIDRRLFSKIRSNPDYKPKKQTALALAFALELNLDETTDLIGRAGIALSDASLFDLLIEYCLENRIYDLYTVNTILFDHDQMLLGG